MVGPRYPRCRSWLASKLKWQPDPISDHTSRQPLTRIFPGISKVKVQGFSACFFCNGNELFRHTGITPARHAVRNSNLNFVI